MASTQVPPFETWPAEIRNRVFKYLAEDAQLYLSATEVVLHEFVHYTPPSPVRQPRLANVHHAEVTDFHFQLASTCTQLRTEYLPVLLANTTLWVHGKDCGANDVLSGLPLVYRSGIRRVATLETAALGFDTATFAMLPALESIEYNMEPLDWVPPTKVEFASYMAGMAYGYGLIQAHREWLYMGNDDQDFLFLLPGGIPMNITVTVAHCARIRLDSKRAMLAIRGVGPVPEKDDQECIVEIRYDWRSGKLIGGVEELEKAWRHVRDSFDYDATVDGYLNQLNTTPDMDEAERDQLEYLVEDWNNREGYCYVAEGREWAWKGVVEELDY